MSAAVALGDTYRLQVEVLHPLLRALMGLREDEEAHHDMQLSLTRDPVTLQQVYTVAEIDVTAAVLAKRQVHLAHAQLAQEQVRARTDIYLMPFVYLYIQMNAPTTPRPHYSGPHGGSASSAAQPHRVPGLGVGGRQVNPKIPPFFEGCITNLAAMKA